MYAGTIRHRRFAVRSHEFRHRIAFAYLDLDALPARFGVTAPIAAVKLLTMPRSLGVGFNPVSFYYCFDEGGELTHVVAEVTNTPVGRAARVRAAAAARASPDKALHVSPFMGMDHEYDVRATAPGETLSVHIASRRAGELAFDATLQPQAPPVQPRAAARRLDPHPDLDLRARPRAEAQGRAVLPASPTGGLVKFHTVARGLVTALLERIESGQLTLVENGIRTVYGSGSPQATVVVRDPRTWTALRKGGKGPRRVLRRRLVGLAGRDRGDRGRRAQPARDRRAPAPADAGARAVAARPRVPARATRRCARATTSPPTTTSATTCSS